MAWNMVRCAASWLRSGGKCAAAQAVEPRLVGRRRACARDDQRPGHWSLASRFGARRSRRGSRRGDEPVVLDLRIAPVDAAQRLADPGDPALGDDEIGRAAAAAAEHRLDARRRVRRRPPRPASPWSAARREQGLARQVGALLPAPPSPPSSILACRPSQRQMPNRLSAVRTTFCHSRFAWPVVMPSASQASEPTVKTMKP